MNKALLGRWGFKAMLQKPLQKTAPVLLRERRVALGVAESIQGSVDSATTPCGSAQNDGGRSLRTDGEKKPAGLFERRLDARLTKWRSGYTAIELMVVVALIAIVTAVALPGFSALIDRWRVRHAITQLQNVIRLANAQAIRTRSNVVIRVKPASCRSLQDTQNWSCGLTVFQDINQNNTQDAGEPTLQEVQEFHALTVTHTGGSNAYLSYGPHGAPIANPGRFEVYPAARPGSSAAQTICLSFGGRMRVKAGAGPC